jgi:uncharacterized protein (TIGR03067 family)
MWSLLVVLVWVAAPGGPGTNDTLKDLQAMQGTWKVAELTEKGRKLPAKETDPIEVVIIGTKMTIRDDGAAREEIMLKFDVAKTLGLGRAVDFSYTKGPSTGNIERAIYSISADTLQFCINEFKDGQRPTAFASTRRNGFAFVVLTRTK